MSILCCLTEEIKEASLVAYIRIGGNAKIAGNGVGGDETNTVDVGRQLVGIA